jgi:hypothetical protein
MTTPNRSDLINTVYRVLKKHYKPVRPPAERLVMEHLIYACLLENARPDAADESLAKLQQLYFDTNEVRVTTAGELAEVFSALPDPLEAATRLKRCLQSVFETVYAFDLEELKKETLGKAVSELEKIRGTTPFTVAYVAQHGFGGHSIPTSKGVVDAMFMIGAINEGEAKKGRVPGLERAIPKAKGVEFASLLHQLGADYFDAPTSRKVRSILIEIAPDAKERLRVHDEKAATAASQAAAKAAAKSRSQSSAEKEAKPTKKTKESKDSKDAKSAPEVKEPKRAAESKPPVAAKSAEPSRKKDSTGPTKSEEKKLADERKKKKPGEKKSPTKQLSRKKPR